MPRARNIKPGFFVNDELAELPPITRLLFIGLWTIADRAGRLEDRPKRIRAQVLPFDDCDVDQALQALNDAAFLVRYEVGGRRYIEITNFTKHQNPHMKEPESEIPAPDEYGASTVQAPCEHDESPADSLNLIPDSLNLIPDTGYHEEIVSSAEPTPTPPPATKATVPYQDIIDAYHEHCPSLPRVRSVTDKRRKAMRVLWSELGGMDTLVELFTMAEQSDFLTGRSGKWNGCNLDWLLNRNNAVKVLEDTYAERASPGNNGRGTPKFTTQGERGRQLVEKYRAEEAEHDESRDGTTTDIDSGDV